MDPHNEIAREFLISSYGTRGAKRACASDYNGAISDLAKVQRLDKAHKFQYYLKTLALVYAARATDKENHNDNQLLKRLQEKRRLIQVLAGPRQVGKTTIARQVMEASKLPAHYASADEPTMRDRAWLEQQWDIARLKAKDSKSGALLVLDEIQKISDWSAAVKMLWDQDSHSALGLKVILLDSSPLLIQGGLTESLAGRFEIIPVPHWSYSEMQAAFGWTVDQYIFYGAYPGAAELIDDPVRWQRYILDSLIETTISRDI